MNDSEKAIQPSPRPLTMEELQEILAEIRC